jgi:hypothetical protein
LSFLWKTVHIPKWEFRDVTMALLQHPIKVDGVFRPGTRGMHPTMVVLPGSLGLDVLSVTFHAHPPKGTLGTRQSILPCSDDAFSTV